MSDPQNQIGKISPDGKWRWDGSAWQPVQPAQTATPRPRRGVLGYLVVGVVGLIAGGICGAATVGSSNQTTQSGHSPSANPSAPAAVSSAAASKSLAQAYATGATPHFAPLVDALTKMGNDCSAQLAPACRADAVTVGSLSKSFLTAIANQTVPACLGATNQELATALELLQDASAAAVAGIDRNDAGQLTRAADLLTVASTHLSKANTLLTALPCG